MVVATHYVQQEHHILTLAGALCVSLQRWHFPNSSKQCFASKYEPAAAAQLQQLMMSQLLYTLCVQVDPTLSRTVLVSTKFDTRLPQFSTPSDVEAFLKAPGLACDVQMLGGSPFFT